MKDADAAVRDFNQYVNMTASELEKWLKTNVSKSAEEPGNGDASESVDLVSGQKIMKILKDNPNKNPKDYTNEQVQYMSKVVAYYKRYLAQEGEKLREKSTEEVKKSKSYISLKNRGYDLLKESSSNGSNKDKNKEEATGEKRKARNSQTGESKKRETTKGSAESTRESRAKARNATKQHKNDDTNQKEEDNADEKSKGNGNGTKAKKGPKPGQTVSWNWGSGQPEGKVLDVKGERTTITTKRGNKVSRDGKPDDPAVVIDTGKSKAVKSNHELN